MPQGEADFEAFIRDRAQPPPAVLYKYTTAGTARLILSTGKIRFQSPFRYNDPFDSQWDVHWPLLTPEARAFERDLIEQAIRDPASWPDDADPEQREAMDGVRAEIQARSEEEQERDIQAMVDDLVQEGEIPEGLMGRLADIRRRMRVLCLSAKDDSILMWSHYANQHRGVVLGFASEALERHRKCPLEPVQYEEGPPQLFDHEVWIRGCVFGTEMLSMIRPDRKWALTKHSGWHHEQEWRFVSVADHGTLGDHGDFEFPGHALVEVTTGCRTDEVEARELRALAYGIHPQVRCFRMSMDRTRFALTKSKI